MKIYGRLKYDLNTMCQIYKRSHIHEFDWGFKVKL